MMLPILLLVILLILLIDVAVLPVVLALMRVGLIHGMLVINALNKMNITFFFKGKHFWTWFAYAQLPLILFISIILFMKWLQLRKVKRQNDTDSDNFGGIKGSARFATDEEILKRWGGNSSK